MPTTLITGANRGIGLALTREFIARGDTVHATARDPGNAEDLKATGAHVHRLDVSSAHSITSLKEAFDGIPIDRLINNAGVGARSSLGELDYEEFERVLIVNTIAPIRMIEAFADNVAESEGRMIASVSSTMGSIAHTDAGWGLIYRTSKAALNMALRAAARTLAERDITLLTLHPGWVSTDMGGPQAPVTPEESAKGLAEVILTAGPATELRFLDYQGKDLPW